MQVEQINAHIPQGLALGKVKQLEKEPEPQNPATLSDAGQNIEQITEQTSDDNAQGVIRLLQEGHFKGVADVRLRINFHDELAALEASQVNAAAAENISIITDSVGPGTQALVDSGQLTQELADEATTAFQQGVNQAINGFQSGQITSRDGLASHLQSVFNDFITFLNANIIPQAQLGPPAQADTVETESPADEIAPEQSAEDTVPQADEPIEPAPDAVTSGQSAEDTAPQEDKPVEPAEDITIPDLTAERPITEDIAAGQTEEPQLNETPAYITELTSAFNSAVEQFMSTINSINVLPELSQPSGNGVAYQKFLEIYNQLYGLTPESTSSDTAALNTVT